MRGVASVLADPRRFLQGAVGRPASAPVMTSGQQQELLRRATWLLSGDTLICYASFHAVIREL